MGQRNVFVQAPAVRVASARAESSTRSFHAVGVATERHRRSGLPHLGRKALHVADAHSPWRARVRLVRRSRRAGPQRGAGVEADECDRFLSAHAVAL